MIFKKNKKKANDTLGSAVIWELLFAEGSMFRYMTKIGGLIGTIAFGLISIGFIYLAFKNGIKEGWEWLLFAAFFAFVARKPWQWFWDFRKAKPPKTLTEKEEGVKYD